MSMPSAAAGVAPGGFARTPSNSNGFVRTPSGCFARAVSSASVISRTSSHAGSVSEWADGCDAMEGVNGAGRGEKRTRSRNTPKRRPWSTDEHERFVESLKRFGSRDKADSGGRVTVGLGPGVAEVIAVVVGTRTVSQVRSHAQKYFISLSRTASATSQLGTGKSKQDASKQDASAATALPTPTNPPTFAPTNQASASAQPSASSSTKGITLIAPKCEPQPDISSHLCRATRIESATPASGPAILASAQHGRC